MSRAESLSVASQHLSDAVRGLDGAARVLDRAGVLGASDQAQRLHDGAKSVHTEISLAALVAHRAERPEFYDESRPVGRPSGWNGEELMATDETTRQ